MMQDRFNAWAVSKVAKVGSTQPASGDYVIADSEDSFHAYIIDGEKIGHYESMNEAVDAVFAAMGDNLDKIWYLYPMVKLKSSKPS
jgi:hypothetical protein